MNGKHGEHSVANRNKMVFNAYETVENDPPSLMKAQAICKVLASIEPRKAVSDVGCNTGVSTAFYAKVPGVESMEGFDIADKAVQIGKEKGLHVHVWHGGVEKCPTEDNRYDVVIASEIIEHIVDTDFFMNELKRVIKPGGHAIITTPNLYYWLSRLKFLLGCAPWNYPSVSSNFKLDRNILTEHIRVNGMKEWTAFFEYLGFEVVRTQGLGWAAPTSFKSRLIYLIDKMMPKKLACLSLFVLKVKK